MIPPTPALGPSVHSLPTPMRLLLTALLLAAPAAAQELVPSSQEFPRPSADELAALTPEAMLAATWASALGGATSTGWQLEAVEEARADSTLSDDERLFSLHDALASAATQAAAATSDLMAAQRFTLALADPAERADTEAAFGEDATRLYWILGITADVARDASLARTDAEFAASDAPASWTQTIAQIHALVGRLRQATASLGIAR